MGPAAFFDLDRTLLTGASGPMFSTMLKRVGLLPDRSIPGEGLVFKFFDVVGETLPSMMATRQMARAASGWDRTLVQEAGELAAQRLVDAVPGFAKALIAVRPGEAARRRAGPRRRHRHEVRRGRRALRRVHRRLLRVGAGQARRR